MGSGQGPQYKELVVFKTESRFLKELLEEAEQLVSLGLNAQIGLDQRG